MIGRELGPLPLRFRLWLLEQCGRRSGRELHALVARSPGRPSRGLGCALRSLPVCASVPSPCACVDGTCRAR